MLSVFRAAAGRVVRGDVRYYAWMVFLLALIGLAISRYVRQLDRGLITTAMRDQVSWGFYIANFTFLVGIAAAAILLVIPAYLYQFRPIREIVLFGEMVAITAVIMCALFIMVDLGQPLRVWHAWPVLGIMNFPSSLFIWDALALLGYLAINVLLVLYALWRLATGREYRLSLIFPLIVLSIPWAVSIHTITAFLYNGLPSRPFWNASILAPRFLASAFCSGPALMLIILQLIRRFSAVEVDNKALFKIAELIAYAMGVNVLLLGAEMFKEFYSGSVHMAPLEYLYFGLRGQGMLQPWIWEATAFNLIAFLIFLVPRLRERPLFLNLGAVLIVLGVYVEKGMGLVVPGFVPDTLGEIYEYWPTVSEGIIAAGIWATGALLFTLMVKFTVPIYTGQIRAERAAERGRR
ncbi:MAG: polysulfide reductase [Candidatus Rokubacteria bacterium RBG_16_73_20]|nr:MAG: polysulfide reductase [Candidatus Rokubacteria bacterium GWA2_73_35]OGK94877.1 MAG: polysulfide reductase [Candidatus Rokubacteria bacterium RBG_16_73_20]HBH03112.1 polysulfide reductase [Candidatus Rokubacteria bacterium]